VHTKFHNTDGYNIDQTTSVILQERASLSVCSLIGLLSLLCRYYRPTILSDNASRFTR
jgi:hypothetical protein